MTRGLRRARGTPPELGIFEVSGSLDGIELGGRVVKVLRVRRMDSETVEGLEPLRRLPDLREVELVHVTGVDLSALAHLGVERLTLQEVRGLDLAALEDLPKLRYLQVFNFAECRVPERLRLAASLENLLVANDARDLSGAPVKRMIEAIDWEGLPNLFGLVLSVGGMEMLPAIEVDVGFLRHLTGLRLLRLDQGVWPAAGGPTLFEPPFDALPPNLQTIRITAWDPPRAERALRARGLAAAVYGRPAEQEILRSWTPVETSDAWTMYGSLSAVFDDDAFADEYAAAAEAERRLHAADAALPDRIDFDPESAGTGIAARSRDDLDRVLRILGINPG